jgi:hypothetical protein
MIRNRAFLMALLIPLLLELLVFFSGVPTSSKGLPGGMEQVAEDVCETEECEQTEAEVLGADLGRLRQLVHHRDFGFSKRVFPVSSAESACLARGWSRLRQSTPSP